MDGDDSGIQGLGDHPPAFHTLGQTLSDTSATTVSRSCSAMVDKKARLCGLDETGVQLAKMGYCEICFDPGEAGFTAFMAGATTCAEAEACGCSE